ncbi:uncharacterized protein EDB91DRAFT_1251134 [Suillus paluster]|uniref:uncharacterized protein n=1 Tax=Suillus paluster TaxID=48578 RepID=UPI001B87F988|nr:uncharacterized protein EDB91DRAFT_1251134 [Suillus paluster]KAG1734085.1 hypothetical protein EDB91DRAFT_1251134 [Suillus paluster]
MSTCAPSPFDHQKADIILRSSDGVDFRVFKLFLTLASPFFEIMFELPNRRFCYPSTLAEDPSLESLTDIQAILGAARKYSLDLIERKVCQALANPKVLEVEPLRCFAIARNARLKHETITAARYTLQQPLIPAWFAEIELITASDLLALLTYHKKCGIAVEPLLANLDWVMSHYGSSGGCNWLFLPQIPGSKSNCQCGRSTEAKFKLWAPAPVLWWATYMNETFELLRDIPSGDVARSEAEKTIQKVRSAGCTTCSSQVKANMEEFSNLLALNVEKATASIELEMDF